MERLTLVIISLFLILFLGQVFLREYFVVTADISNSTLTMSLSDLLYTIGAGTQQQQKQQEHYHKDESDDLEQYLMMKEEMLHSVKSEINSALPSLLKKSSEQAPLSMTHLSPSCAQGSAYMESVPLVTSSCKS